MNEKIKELAKQADEGYTGNSEYDMGDALVGNDAIKKFAELIIQECIEVAENTAMGERTYGWMVGNNITDHFGIEDK